MNPQEFFGKDYKEFGQKDPFNGNYVEGYISHRSDNTYGAILIERVNWDKCPQLIYCTPKIPYPFDKTGNWHFPKAVRIERYEKLDGTNIFSYRYYDIKDKVFVAHKTRLLPFVGNSRFGPFLDMLEDLWGNDPHLKMAPLLLSQNISFELWGARNPHLVRYEEPLKLSVLFARNGPNIYPPSTIDGDLPSAPFKGIVERDYIGSYKQSQQIMDTRLKEEEGYYKGQEGEVWYLLTEDAIWHLFKCKPETIEAIHWSAGGIGKNQIRATCENALENWDSPAIENIASLLLEEFPQAEVDKAYYLIERTLADVIKNHEFADNILRDYKEIGINILEDKVAVMRKLAQKYRREQMKRVFRIIWDKETK